MERERTDCTGLRGLGGGILATRPTSAPATPGRPDTRPDPSAAPDGPSAARCVSILAETAAPILARAPVAVARAVSGVHGLLGIAPWRQSRHPEPWAAWREAAAVLARELPEGTHAERAQRRAVWAALEAADAAWEAGR